MNARLLPFAALALAACESLTVSADQLDGPRKPSSPAHATFDGAPAEPTPAYDAEDAGDVVPQLAFDAGQPPAEPSDAGLPPAGVPDAGPSDAGLPALGAFDAGAPSVDAGCLCATPVHAPTTCVAGVCGRGPCDPTWFDVDGDTTLGCESQCEGARCLLPDGGTIELDAPPLSERARGALSAAPLLVTPQALGELSSTTSFPAQSTAHVLHPLVP